MKNNLFDTFIKEKLAQHKPEVPAHIWSKIALQNNKHKPLFFLKKGFSRAAAILLLITTIGALSYLLLNRNNQVNTTVIAKQSSPVLQKKTNSTTNHTNTIVTPPEAINEREILNNQAIELSTIDQTSADGNKKLYTTATTKITFTAALPTVDDENISTDQFLFSKNTLPTDKIKTDFNYNPNLLLPNLPTTTIIPDLEAEKNAAGNKRYIELYASADYVFKTYEDGDGDYIAKRKASTALNYAITTGVRYTKVFKNGVSVKTGLHYSRVSEKFFGKNGYDLNEVASLNANGDTIGNYLLVTPQYESKNNVYHSIDIPLQMGYEMGNGKWHTNISAGASVNVFSKQNASVINTDGLAEDVTTGKSTSRYRYKTKAGVSLLASLGVYYKVNKKTHVLAEPYLRYSLSPANLPSIDLKQKMHTTGVRIGIRKDL